MGVSSRTKMPSNRTTLVAKDVIRVVVKSEWGEMSVIEANEFSKT